MERARLEPAAPVEREAPRIRVVEVTLEPQYVVEVRVVRD